MIPSLEGTTCAPASSPRPDKRATHRKMGTVGVHEEGADLGSVCSLVGGAPGWTTQHPPPLFFPPPVSSCGSRSTRHRSGATFTVGKSGCFGIPSGVSSHAQSHSLGAGLTNAMRESRVRFWGHLMRRDVSTPSRGQLPVESNAPPTSSAALAPLSSDPHARLASRTVSPEDEFKTSRRQFHGAGSAGADPERHTPRHTRTQVSKSAQPASQQMLCY